MQKGTSTFISNASSQYQGEKKTNTQKLALTLFWIGLIFAIAFAGFGSRSLLYNLRTMTIEQNNATIWADGGLLWILWGFSVTLGSVLAGIGAFIYVKTRPVFSWLTGIGVIGVVFVMLMVWGRVYNPTLFGLGGGVILVSFFAIVLVWMKKYAGLGMPEKIAGSFKLVGYIFWIQASWFLCGETARMHLKAFADLSPPSPIEVMVFLVLGWLFVLAGEYRSMQLRRQ